MKEDLVNLINSENVLSQGSLLQQPVNGYVDKILQHAQLLTHYSQGCLAGFVAYYCNDPGKESAFLTMLCVASKYKGKGIGKKLLNASIADIKSKGFRWYALEVKETNIPAMTLYKNSGFNITGKSGTKLQMKMESAHES